MKYNCKELRSDVQFILVPVSQRLCIYICQWRLVASVSVGYLYKQVLNTLAAFQYILMLSNGSIREAMMSVAIKNP